MALDYSIISNALNASTQASGQRMQLMSQYNPAAMFQNAQQNVAQTQQILAQAQNIQANTGVQHQDAINIAIKNKASEFQLGMQKFGVAQQIFGAVNMNPNATTYNMALNQLNKLGVDVSDAPASWGDDANQYINQKSVQSGQALDWYKAQYSMMLQRSQMVNQAMNTQANTLKANIAAAQAGMGNQQLPMGGNPNNLPVPNVSQAGQPNQLNASQGNSGTANNIAVPYNPQQMMGVSSPGQGGMGQGDVGSNPNQVLPAQVQGQEAQAKAWSSYNSSVTAADSSYNQRMSTLKQTQDVVNNLPGWRQNPIAAKLGVDNLPDNQRLEDLGSATELQQIGDMSNQYGIKRTLPQVYDAIANTVPGSEKWKQNNQAAVGYQMYVAQSTHAQAEVAPFAQQAGVNDPTQFQNMVQNAIQQTGAINQQTGALDPLKAQTFVQNLPPQIQAAMQQSGSVDSSLLFQVTPNDIDQARASGMSDSDITKLASGYEKSKRK